MNNVLIDLSNLTHIIRHSKFKKNKEPYDSTMLFKYVLDSILYYANKFRTDGVLVAVDSKDTWRKAFYPAYKQHREALRDEHYEDTINVMKAIKMFLDNHTSVSALAVPGAEADDIIAVCSQTNMHGSVVVSSDKDFIQLISPTVQVFNPVDQKYRETEDRAFELFLKIIRGDKGDNVPSAYPRVREKKLKEIIKDKAEIANMMNSKNAFGEVIKDAYQRNNKLINLMMQPAEIRDDITAALKTVGTTHQNYHFVRTRRMLCEMGFENVVDEFNFDNMKKPFWYQTLPSK